MVERSFTLPTPALYQGYSTGAGQEWGFLLGLDLFLVTVRIFGRISDAVASILGKLSIIICIIPVRFLLFYSY